MVAAILISRYPDLLSTKNAAFSGVLVDSAQPDRVDATQTARGAGPTGGLGTVTLRTENSMQNQIWV